LDDLITLASEEWIEGDQKRLGSLLDEHQECGFKLAVAAGAQDLPRRGDTQQAHTEQL
jgi:hypothetical protein